MPDVERYAGRAYRCDYGKNPDLGYKCWHLHPVESLDDFQYHQLIREARRYEGTDLFISLVLSGEIMVDECVRRFNPVLHLGCEDVFQLFRLVANDGVVVELHDSSDQWLIGFR